MMFYTRISCDPPLGTSTVIPPQDKQIKFTILLETNEQTILKDWEVSIWHNCHDAATAWTDIDLESLDSVTGITPLAVRRDINQYRKHHFFTASIPIPQGATGSREFTIRYRKRNQYWIWVNFQSGALNGELIFQKSSLPKHISECFTKFTSTAAIESVRSEVRETQLWSVHFDVPAAGKTSTLQDYFLGIPLYVARWWALVREWAAWLRPAHGHGLWKVEKDAMVCSFQCRDGLHLVLLAISGVDDVQTVFRDDGYAGIVVRARNDSTSEAKAKVLAAVGYSHETALAACMYGARNLIQRGYYTSTETEVAETISDVKPNWYSTWSDGIGYCTWNALGKELTEQKILDALKILRDNKVKIQSLIIDDNWQTLDQSNPDHHYHTWSDFEANPDGFPNGLSGAISAIREQNQSIQHITVWHAILGYWGGITPNSPIAQKYKTKEIKRMDSGRKGFEATKLTVVIGEESENLFKDFYAFLRDAGVDSVKTDAQMMLDLIQHPDDRQAIIRPYQDAWDLSGLQNFQDRVISCMSHYPDNFFHSLLPSKRPAITLRNSDDFWPNEPDSHTWHIFTNAHNSLFTQYLNVIPDWDMFQTTHEFAAFHAAARCISGGPIYITDEPGKHNFELIKQMTAETTKGTTAILRPSRPARAVASSVYISNSEPRLLKIGSYHGRSSTGTGILGVFNCSEGPLLDLIHLRDFSGVEASERYIIRSFTSGQLSQPMTLSGEGAVVSMDLEVRGWDILTSHPVWSLSRDKTTIDIAPLGLIDKMSGAAAIVEYGFVPERVQRLQLSVTLKALGVLGVYISDLGKRSIEEDFMVNIYDWFVPIETVSVEGSVLKIDVATAWASIEEPPSWNNEVTIDILIAW